METKISKKKMYWVTESHTVVRVVSFEVEANNQQEAIDKVKQGGGMTRKVEYFDEKILGWTSEYWGRK
jgi:hypothetical protein